MIVEAILISVAGLITMIIGKIVFNNSNCASECCDITIQTEPDAENSIKE